MTRSLVTGGSGYFGSLLVQRLVAAGHDVRVLDLVDADDRPAGVEFVAGDIRDREAVRSAVDEVDVVFHNVAQVPLARDDELFRSVNVDGTVVLLDACADAGVGKVVHTSSSAVFGIPRINPVLPETVPSPVEAYGHAKLAAEWACLAAVGAARTSPSSGRARSSATAASGSSGSCSTGSPTAPTCSCSATARTATSSSTPTTSPSAAASPASTPARRSSTAAPIASGRCVTRWKVCAPTPAPARRSARCPPGRRRRRCTPPPLHLAPFAPYHWTMYAESLWFDIDHARELLGWQPRYSNVEMLVDSYEWFLRNRAETTADGRSHHRTTAKQGVLGAMKKATRLLPG